MEVRVRLLARICVSSMFLSLLSAAGLSAQEVVLHSTDVTNIRGNWARVSTSGAASGVAMTSTDRGWSSTSQPQASPTDYFEASFTAQAYTSYRIWLRMRAAGDSKWNESVWVQFGDSLNGAGSAAYRVGTTSGIIFNLEDCNGCGVAGWGWTGGSYWVGMNQQVQFPSSGTKTIRIQTREDGAQIDQIVLSPSRYLSSPPGSATNDTTILARCGGASAAASTTAKPLPGTIEAEDFDNGGNGAAYYDRSAGNNGGQYRSTDVDIETSTDGGYDVGWIDAGEWLDYTVNVASAGTYTMEFRVASPNGSTLRATFGGVDETGSVGVPATGGWQRWTTVSRTVNLAGGTQVLRIVFDTGALNINRVRLTSGSTAVTDESGSGPKGGTAWAFPGTVQAEDFDLGGEDVGYSDNTSGNAGGKYRTVNADIESTTDTGGGYDLGWTSAGEWTKYTVNVTTAGTYTLTARVASSGSGGTFHVEFNGTNKTGTLTVPNTGGWQSFRDVTATVSLSAGVQTMRLVFDGNGSTGAVGNVNYLRVSDVLTTPISSTSGRIKIMTWNIHFGKNASNVLNLDGQAQVMANSGADVILLQEASTWDGDQPNAFPTLLRQKTGQTWYKVWSAHTAGSTTGEGTLILTRLPIVSSSIANFGNRGFGRVTVSVSGVNITIFDAHLTYSDTAKRTSELNSLMSWARNYAGPRILGGDFNSWWGETWIKTVETEYSDTWVDVTGSNQNGYTHNNIRFDYLFRSFVNASRMTPTSCVVISTTLSDHRPVVAEYTVR